MNLREQMQTRLENRCAMEPDNHIKNGRSDSCSCPNDRITAYTMRNTRRDAINRVSTNRQICGSKLPSFGGAGGGVFGGAGGGFLLILFLAITTLSFAQGNSGLGFNYQAVVRGTDGFLLKNQNVELRISLKAGQGVTQDAWVETHSGPLVYTDDFGVVSVKVGKGVKAGGTAQTFEAVDFSTDFYWMKVEVKRQGGNYSNLQDYTALPSVPYAEVADNARSAASVIQEIRDEIDQALDENQIAFNVLMANTQNALAELNILLENSQNALAQLNDALAQVEAKTVPVGTIAAFAGPLTKEDGTSNIPPGWFLCDGTLLSQIEYSALFAVIGTAWGWNVPEDQFRVPDLCGLFLRGADNGYGRDTDANGRTNLENSSITVGSVVGSYQGDAIREIEGEINLMTNSESPGGQAPHTKTGVFSQTNTTQGKFNTTQINYTTGYWTEPNIYFKASASGVPVGGDNRPQNVYVNYIIKY